MGPLFVLSVRYTCIGTLTETVQLSHNHDQLGELTILPRLYNIKVVVIPPDKQTNKHTECLQIKVVRSLPHGHKYLLKTTLFTYDL